MKHSIFTVALEDLSYEEIANILSDEGYDGVEWRVTHPKENEAMKHLNLLDIETQAKKVKSLCNSLGLEMPALASYENLDKTDRIERLFHLANLLGVPFVRIHPRLYETNPHYDIRVSDLVQDIRSILPIAVKYSVKPVLEIHMGTIYPGPSDIRKIVDHFSPEEIGVIIDPGNMVIEGMIDWTLAVQILGQYLVHVHVKNSGWRKHDDDKWKWEWMPLEGGMVNWRDVIQSLKKAGYDGYLSQEDFFSFSVARPQSMKDKSELTKYIKRILNQNKKYLDNLM